MGEMKFGFANSSDIFLHDTPNKELFAKAERNLSRRLRPPVRRPAPCPLAARPRGGHRFGASPSSMSRCPAPVPIYITYLTAQPDQSGGIRVRR